MGDIDRNQQRTAIDHVDERHRMAAWELAHPSASVVAAIATLGLEPGMTVLDVGCGAGAHLGLFAAKIAPDGVVTGVDVGVEQLAIASDLHAARIANGTVVVQAGDLAKLPFGDDTFDATWMSAVLHHVEGPVDALIEMGRVVRPGGLVAVLDADSDGSFPCLPWPPEFEHTLRAAALRAQRDNFGGRLPYAFDGYVGRQLPRLFGEARLAGVRMQAFTHVDTGPLSRNAEAALCDWAIASFGERVRDYLALRDRDRLERSFTLGSPDFLPAQPGFFVARMSFLATGVVQA